MDALYRLFLLWEVEAQKLNCSEQNDNHFAKENFPLYGSLLP